MSACSNKIRSAHSRSGKRDKDSQPWWPVSSLSPACSGEGTRPLLAAFPEHRVLLVQGRVCITFIFHFHALEKEMATHSHVLAWRIPGTGEPGGLPSMGSHRVWTRLKRPQGEKSRPLIIGVEASPFLCVLVTPSLGLPWWLRG